MQTTPGATQHFWTANRAILFASFSASLAYFAGAYDVWSGTRKEEHAIKAVEEKPVYANKKELEQVILYFVHYSRAQVMLTAHRV